MADVRKLNYEIHKYSSYSTSYLPENIREDCPSNQTSRWSSNTNSPPQYLTLRLPRPAIVHKIKFGKHEKTHVCNLRKFKIFGGLEEEHLVTLFEGGLKNDSVPEIFDLRHTTDSGDFLPILYIQIMPLLSWGPSFNFSIWYVELLGQDDPIFIRTSLRNYNMLRELEIIRLCLKHFRQQGYETAFQALQDQTSVHLEHPVMSELHNELVINGDFVKVEQFIEQFVNEGLMDSYLTKQDYKAVWLQQEVNNSEKRPGMRGGHQLIVDSANSKMYLFGGWDGFEDLSDLWCYDIKQNSWQLIHDRAENYDGPAPRSCHKMLFDSTNSQIFTLGRYLDSNNRTRENLQSDFYLYNTITKTWLLICDDTSQVGGPQLMFDHQMCIDVAKGMIYVFGGRILTPRNIEDLTNDPQYSGLFSYHISTNTWTHMLVDCAHPMAANPEVGSIKSRVTHSMLFHHRHRKLYIFGGQRNKEYTTDFISFNVDTQEGDILNASDSTNPDCRNMPQSGFTQRATIDCERDEIYVLSSLSKEKERRDLNLNSFWMYSLKTDQWKCIYRCDHSAEPCFTKQQSTCSEPCPRYAHQMVYDWNNKIHYLFGGNPGKNTLPQLRLDDFWILNLQKPSRFEILRHCRYLIRKLEYEEITKTNAIGALTYLQTKLYEIIDHKDPIQLKEFHKLASLLFKSDDAQQQNQQHHQLTPIKSPLSTNEPSTSTSSLDFETDIIKSSHSNINTTIAPIGSVITTYQHSCWNTSSPSSFSPSSSSSSSSTTSFIGTGTGTKTTGGDGGDKIFLTPLDESKLLSSKFEGKQYDTKTRRCMLYNKIVELLPENMVQPKGNLSDFVVI